MKNSNNTPLNWEAHYQAGTTGWDRGKSSLNLINWLDSDELKPCRILVPGCGNGYEVITLAEQGFDVVCADIAPTPVANLKEKLKSRGLQAEVIESDFFAMDFSNKPFDAIYEQTCLCALQPTQWSDFEQWLYASLKSGGKLFSMFMQTHQEGGPPFHCDMSKMKTLFDASRWSWQKEASAKQMSQSDNADKYEIPCLLERI